MVDRVSEDKATICNDPGFGFSALGFRADDHQEEEDEEDEVDLEDVDFVAGAEASEAPEASEVVEVMMVVEERFVGLVVAVAEVVAQDFE